jgi:type I restriction enzyme S subunit
MDKTKVNNTEWEEKELSAICRLVRNIYLPYPDDDKKYIGLEHIGQGTLSLLGIGKASDVTSAKLAFSKGQILFGKLRPYFRKLYRPKFDGVCSTDIFVIDSKENNDNGFLFYFFANPEIIEEATQSSEGTKMPRASWNYLSKLRRRIPPLQEQQAIAKVLSDLDSKIELNQETNKTLEAIGQALFKHWFVDFEFSDEKGRPYKSSGGKMVESELGEIPEGWTISSLGNNGVFKNGINYLRDEEGDTNFSIVNVRDIANNKLLLKESLDKIKLNLSKAQDYLLREKDILIARSACPGEISLVLGDLQNVIYSGFSIRYRLNDTNNYLYIFHIMQGLKKNLQNYSIGTTLQSVNQETLRNMRFVLPSDKILKEFNKISTQILDKILNNLLQNRELSQIRDSLLPRLMSGRIRVGVD